MKIGYGWDSHEFKRGIPLKIGGVALPHTHGLGGHSDGDVLLHAITDALLGAVAAPDIGSLFSPSDPQWKGADSAVFLRGSSETRAGCRLRGGERGLHADSRRAENRTACREPFARGSAELLGIPGDCIGIKAKTPEGMGTDNAAIAHAVVLLE